MPRTPPWLQSLLEEHFEELQMLWELRLEAVRDADYEMHDLSELDERIAAHVDGLVLSQQDALPIIVEGLSGGERSVVFAAVFAILSMKDPEILGPLFEALDAAEGEALDGFVDGFCCGPTDHCKAALTERLSHPSTGVAAVAMQVLAFSGQINSDHPRIAELVVDDDEDVRKRGWEIVSFASR